MQGICSVLGQLQRVEDWKTTDQAAARLRVSRRRVLKLLKDGRLPSERIGRIHLIRAADLERLAQEITEQEPGKAGRPPNLKRQEGQRE